MPIDLPKHKCGLFLTHNQHKDYYQSAKETIEEQKEHECPPDWRNDEQKQRAIETNEIWELQWYPDTPIGCYAICAPTLKELLEFAKEIENDARSTL
jgi:hypothetical protein